MIDSLGARARLEPPHVVASLAASDKPLLAAIPPALRGILPDQETMWRRSYLLLVAIRLWFALSSSYLHPDENFQGPEVIAGASKPWISGRTGAYNLSPSCRVTAAPSLPELDYTLRVKITNQMPICR